MMHRPRAERHTKLPVRQTVGSPAGGGGACGPGPYDGRMSRTHRPPSHRPAGRGVVLLVLAVLAGVLAMHGLAPGPTPAIAGAAGSGHGAVMTHRTAADTASDSVSDTAGVTAGEPVMEAAGACVHGADGGSGGSGHAHHADATCAAAGVVAAYTPPPPAPAAGVPLPTRVLSGVAAGAPVGGRAPPDLAELQLLRI